MSCLIKGFQGYGAGAGSRGGERLYIVTINLPYREKIFETAHHRSVPNEK